MTGLANAQIVTVEPQEVSAVEPVTITVDLSGTPLAGGDAIFIWAWIEKGDDDIDAPNNGVWENSTDAHELTRVDGDIWTFSITSLRDFYQQSPGVIGEEVGFLFKFRNGTEGQTSNQSLSVNPPRFVDTDFRTFPSGFAVDDVVTIIYNQNLDENEATNGLSEYFLYAVATLDDGAEIAPVAPGEVGATPSLQLQPQGDGTFTLTMIPERFFELTEEDEVTNISFVIRSREDPDIALSPRIRNPITVK